MKLRLLDLFCGAGGASVGYVRAGFEVEGVDIEPQPHYPFKFYQTDALEFPLEGYDAYHASPPCQAYSEATPITTKSKHPKLIKVVHDMLVGSGKSYVIENVEGARWYLENPIMLCGSMFGLGSPIYRCLCGNEFELKLGKYGCPNCEGGNIASPKERYGLRRHRLFECSWGLPFPPASCSHTGQALGVYGKPGGSSKRDGLKFAQFKDWKEGMGIDWMNVKEMAESIPPAYTEYIGKELIRVL